MALYRARDERRKDRDKNAEPIVIADDWGKRLSGIRMAMLEDAIKEAAHHHVSDTTYAKLIRGALDGMMLLTESGSLKDTFPSLGVPVQVSRFREKIQDELQRLDRRTTGMTRVDAMEVLGRVLDANRQSVQLPEHVLVYELAEGAMGTLDEFSGIIWPYDLEDFNRTTQGKFFGVGILIGRNSGKLNVISPLEGTPAHKAGIKPGDFIVKVDQKETAGWTLEEAVRSITGPEGTAVVLTLQRAGRDEPFDVKLVRSEIAIESIKGWSHKTGGGWDYYVDRESRIGYIRMSQFIPQTPDDMDAAINQMQKEGGLSALVLDLRFNPGGLLRKSVDVADRFVSEGVIVSTVGANGQATQRFSARQRQTQPYVPMVVLINQGSASASEIVSGALQDYQRATIIGERSFGKGSVQDLFPIDSGRAVLKLTTQYYRLPGPNGQGGRIIHRRPQDKTWGVEPDLKVHMTEKEVVDALEARRDADVLRELNDGQAPADPGALLVKGLDSQLEAAVLFLKTQLAARDLMLAMSEGK
jgi:carboxyl-terminal processing protease